MYYLCVTDGCCNHLADVFMSLLQTELNYFQDRHTVSLGVPDDLHDLTGM